LVRAAAFIQALDTIRAYCRLADPRMRRIVLETIKDLLPPDEALLPDNETDTNQNTEVCSRRFFSVALKRGRADGAAALVLAVQAAWTAIGGGGPLMCRS
jgi:hypothetical protein